MGKYPRTWCAEVVYKNDEGEAGFLGYPGYPKPSGGTTRPASVADQGFQNEH